MSYGTRAERAARTSWRMWLSLPVVLVGVLSFGTASGQGQPGGSTSSKVIYRCPDLTEKGEWTALEVPVYQGFDGWFFREEDFWSDFILPSATARFFKRLTERLSSQGTRLVILTLPPRSQFALSSVPPDLWSTNNFDADRSRSSFTEFLAELRKSGSLVVDTLPGAKAADVDGLFFKRDIHWTPEGARYFARRVLDTLTQDDVYQSLNKNRFTSTPGPRVPYVAGSFHVALSSICHDLIPRESFTPYRTTADEPSVDEFLGSGETETLALVGTSFSDEAGVLNFAGFLREALEINVANYAIPGGDVDQSIYKYLHEELERGKAPPYLIWELPFPARLEQLSENLMRQLIPAAAGACEGTAVVAERRYTTTGGAPIAIQVRAGQSVTGPEYYLALDLSEGRVANFLVTFRYDDGRVELFAIVRPSRVGPIKKLFAELSPDFKGNLLEVSVLPLEDASLTGKIRLCGPAVEHSL